MATKPTLPPSIWAENRPNLPATTDSQWGQGLQYTSTTSGGKALTETFDYPLFKIDESLRWLRDLFDDNGVISGLPDATETQKGVVEKATTAESESGASDKFPDAAGIHAAFNSIEEQIGVNQSWQDLTSSRSAGVNYTNNAGKPIMVYIALSPGGGNNNAEFATVDGVGVGRGGADSGQANQFIVPDGSIYSVDTGYPIEHWSELR